MFSNSIRFWSIDLDWSRPTNPQTAGTPSSSAASIVDDHEVDFCWPDGGVLVQHVVEVGRRRRSPRRSRRRRRARGRHGPCRTARAGRGCWRPGRASLRPGMSTGRDGSPPTARCSRLRRSLAKSSHSSTARSGSGSRRSRGVSSWRAAVSTPTDMLTGSNGWAGTASSSTGWPRMGGDHDGLMVTGWWVRADSIAACSTRWVFRASAKSGIGDDRVAAADHREDVGGLVDEAVLVAEAVAVGPPGRGVRMAVAAAGDVDRRPALRCARRRTAS